MSIRQDHPNPRDTPGLASNTIRTTVSRSNTKKIYEVSKASLAMLNPAYAMGIDFDMNDSMRYLHSDPHANLPSEICNQEYTPTPELAAFAVEEETPNALGLGIGPTSVDMQRKFSSESVFEDDEDAYIASQEKSKNKPQRVSQRQGSGTPNGSSISRFFSWKRGKATKPNNTTMGWDEPASAPPMMMTFEDAFQRQNHPSYSGSTSVPTTPVGAPIQLQNPPKRFLGRKGSVPTLREVRKATCSPVIQQQHLSMLQQRNMSNRQVYEYEDSNYGPPQSPTVKPVALAHRRVTSVGRGTRKSSYDNHPGISFLPTERTETQSPRSQAPPKRHSKKKRNHEPWRNVEVPPLPTHSPFFSSPPAQALPPLPTEEKGSIERPAMRRRSKSVGAPASSCDPPLYTTSFSAQDTHFQIPELKISTSLGEEDENPSSDGHASSEEASSHQAQRVNLSNRAVVVGYSSPKFVNFSPSLPHTTNMVLPSSCDTLHPSTSAGKDFETNEKRSSSASTIRASDLDDSSLSAPIVNVMPPTPDLGGADEGKFQSTSACLDPQEKAHEGCSSDRDSPSDEQLDEEKTANVESKWRDSCRFSSIANGLGLLSNEQPESTSLPYADAETTEQKRYTGYTTSDASEICDSPASFGRASTAADDEPFGFARSLSSMSLTSDSDESSLATDDIEHDVDADDLESAQIVTISPSTKYSRPQIISSPNSMLKSPPTSQGNDILMSPPRSQYSLPYGQTPSSLPELVSSSSESSVGSSSRQSSERTSGRFSRMPTLSSGQSLASIMTTSTSILDFGSEYIHESQGGSEGQVPSTASEKANPTHNNSMGYLHSPMELQSIIDSMKAGLDGDDCDTPRLSSGFSAPMATSGVQETKPLNITKNFPTIPARDDLQNPMAAMMEKSYTSPGCLPANPSTTPMRAHPRAQSATSPHLELDLSLPLDLHDIGSLLKSDTRSGSKTHGLKTKEAASHQSKPRLPTKSRQRRSVTTSSVQPKTPPNGARLMASALQHDQTMGLGLDFGEQKGVECPPRMMSSDKDPQNTKHERLAAMLRSSQALHSAAGAPSPKQSESSTLEGGVGFAI